NADADIAGLDAMVFRVRYGDEQRDDPQYKNDESRHKQSFHCCLRRDFTDPSTDTRSRTEMRGKGRRLLRGRSEGEESGQGGAQSGISRWLANSVPATTG